MQFIGLNRPTLQVKSTQRFNSQPSFSVRLACVGEDSLLINEKYLIQHSFGPSESNPDLIVDLHVQLGELGLEEIEDKYQKKIKPVGSANFFSDDKYASLNFLCGLKDDVFWETYRSLSEPSAEIRFATMIINLDYGNDPDGKEKVWACDSSKGDVVDTYVDSTRYLHYFTLECYRTENN